MTEIAEVKTIGDVERIVHGSGFWDGTEPVEFSDDGVVWSEAWAPKVETEPARAIVEHASFTISSGPMTRVIQAHPEFARVTVHRKDVRIGTRVTIRWDEQRPRENEEWAAKWDAAPTRHFGRTARMVAFRQTFRDILGDVSIEDEERATPATPAPVERDWRAEFEAATDVDALDAIVKEARAARVFTPTPEGTSLDIAWKAHRKALMADWTPAKDAWTPDDDVAEVLRSTAGAVRATASDRRPAAPRDYLAPEGGNRAQRRAKKRGRR